ALTRVEKWLVLDAALQLAGASGEQPDVQFVPAVAAAPLCTAPWVLSLSHSGPWIATAAAKGPGIAVGVDVEQHKPRDFSRIDQFLGWTSPSQDQDHFYRRWTLAESLFKAAGGIQAKVSFITLDCALQTLASDTQQRSVNLSGYRYTAMWPRTGSNYTLCWLLRQVC
ncbi:MAG: 4'-phosphopantetheinyl transferase family protein, partial [Pseudomonadales bacterium]